MGGANGAINHAEIIIDFGDGSDGGARRARRCFLFNGDRRGKPLDGIHFGPLHLVKELARVGGKGFDVPPLAFGVEGVERQ